MLLAEIVSSTFEGLGEGVFKDKFANCEDSLVIVDGGVEILVWDAWFSGVMSLALTLIALLPVGVDEEGDEPFSRCFCKGSLCFDERSVGVDTVLQFLMMGIFVEPSVTRAYFLCNDVL